MLFLIDENTPTSVKVIFKEKGLEAKCVKDIPDLRGQPDEVIFNYVANKEIIIVTRDLGFTNTFRFDLTKLFGLIVLRFPNEISVKTFCQEVKKSLEGIPEKSFRKRIIIIEPGGIRLRPLP